MTSNESGSGTPRPEHPRPQQMREQWLSLNGTWTYAFGDGQNRFESAVAERPVERGPFASEITIPFAPEARLSGVGDTDFHEQIHYHRTVMVPEAWSDRRVFLHFGAVDFHTDVYVEGEYIGSHSGGSTPFSFDITHCVKPGTTAAITVSVQDYIHRADQASGKQSKRYASHGCLYTRTTGIWQTVWMEAIHPGGLAAVQIDTDAETQRITVRPSAVAGGGNREIELTVYPAVHPAPDDQPVARVRQHFSDGTPLTVEIRDAKLWFPGDPNLYGLVITVYEDGEQIDRVESYAGIRSVSVHDGKIWINGKSVFQRLVLDQGFYADGIWTAPSDEALRRDIELSMAAGFNGARLHQKVFEDRFHYWADRLGYITWSEWPSWGLDANSYAANRAFMTEIADTVAFLRNHPSIIAWTPFNESWFLENRRAYYINHTDAYRLCRTIDPSRPVNGSSGGIHFQTDIYTVHSYASTGEGIREKIGPPDAPNRPVARHAPPYDGQPFVVDEFGGVHWGDHGWGYGEGPTTEAELFARVGELVETLNSHPLVSGWCYTQLTDVEQEQNGVYTYNREEKFPTARWAEHFSRVPARFDM